MKKFLSMACLLGALMLTGCTEDTQGASTYDVREALYNRTFVQKFGEIAPDQNWDFYAQAVANKQASTDTKRFVCEDIGDVGDFDFNDLVFDLQKTADGTDLVIRAVGGTLPIVLKVGDTTTEELHGIFGIRIRNTINVGYASGGVKRDPIKIHLNQQITDLTTFTDVQVKVSYPEGDVAYIGFARNGEVPKMFAVPATTKWTKESTNIKSAYSGFFATDGWYGSPTDIGKLW